jgi:hypothetical protein
MALALNVYKTVTSIASTSAVGIYTAPVGYAGVVLLAQVANIGSQTYTVTVSHRRSVAGVAVTTEIVKDYAVPANDSVSVLDGRLIMESNDVLVLSANNATNLKFIGSILETLK